MIAANQWTLSGISSVEPSAETVIRGDLNTLVLAGPGAGKTELLAQRACFLLQTNSCKAPKRVLAISFKKDSAANLKARVESRCGDSLSRRFDSMTFDAFSKSILDRFRNALPREYRPSSNYTIGCEASYIHSLLSRLDYSDRPGNYPLHRIVNCEERYVNWNIRNFENEFLTSYSLDDSERNSEYILSWAADRVWELLISGEFTDNQSVLSFQMISRLAEHIIKSNPFIKMALRDTYSHVFLDEFQDTTGIQYDLLKACFEGSRSTMTAVGDGKQRIMLWAGALPTIFEDYCSGFNADRVILEMNYRCAPEIVQLQTYIARTLVADAPGQTSAVASGGVLRRVDFRDDEQEARKLASKVAHLVQTEGILPEEICILIKQRVGQNSLKIIQALRELGYVARNEEPYQDLIKDSLIQILLNFIKYIYINDSTSWERCLEVIVNDHTNIRDLREGESKLHTLVERYRNTFAQNFQNAEGCKNLVLRIISTIGEDAVRTLGDQYTTEYVDYLVETFCEMMSEVSIRCENITAAIDQFEGKGVIPCMTIHKSKGLEFKVIFLVGLDDQLFWSYERQSNEDLQAIFVAVSRAISHLYITYSDWRNDESTSRRSIAPVYELLDQAGVEYCNCR